MKAVPFHWREEGSLISLPLSYLCIKFSILGACMQLCPWPTCHPGTRKQTAASPDCPPLTWRAPETHATSLGPLKAFYSLQKAFKQDFRFSSENQMYCLMALQRVQKAFRRALGHHAQPDWPSGRLCRISAVIQWGALTSQACHLGTLAPHRIMAGPPVSVYASEWNLHISHTQRMHPMGK